MQDELVSLVHSGPPCPDDFIFHDGLGLCINIFDEPLNWKKANRKCIDADASLAMAKDQTTNDILFSLMGDSTDPDPMWLGLTDKAEEGVWR